jgi:hypothetical protein
MNRQMVLASMGSPESKVRESTASGERYEEWIYGHQPQTMRFVRFAGDRVSLVKVAKLGQPIEVHDQNELAGYLPPTPVRTIAEGDGDSATTRKGPPSLKKPGETLPDEGLEANQTGKVQYPVPKKPADGSGAATASTPVAAPTVAPAVGAPPDPNHPQ